MSRARGRSASEAGFQQRIKRIVQQESHQLDYLYAIADALDRAAP